jgi:hypothetical protein
MDDWRESASMSGNDEGSSKDVSLSLVRAKSSRVEVDAADSATSTRWSVLRSARACVRNPRRLGRVSSPTFEVVPA